jgi:hypothetical protein
MLRGIFRLKRDEATGNWRKVDNKELSNSYSKPNIRSMQLASHVECMKKKEEGTQDFDGKTGKKGNTRKTKT